MRLQKQEKLNEKETVVLNLPHLQVVIHTLLLLWASQKNNV